MDVPESPLVIFELFFSEELLEVIAEESNRYTQQVMGEVRYLT